MHAAALKNLFHLVGEAWKLEDACFMEHHWSRNRKNFGKRYDSADFWLELTPRLQPDVCARSEVEVELVAKTSPSKSNAIGVEWHNVGGVPLQKCQIAGVQKHHNL